MVTKISTRVAEIRRELFLIRYGYDLPTDCNGCADASRAIAAILEQVEHLSEQLKFERQRHSRAERKSYGGLR